MCNKYIVNWSRSEDSSHINLYLCAHFLLGDIMEEKYFAELIKLIKKASKKDEVPISAMVVKENKIISKAYNRRVKKNNVLAHAEIIAINKASKKLKDWRLNNCDLYVTLKPCSMCETIIKQSRIRNVYYLLEKPKEKKEYNKTKFYKANICTYVTEYEARLRDFFKKKRDK